MFWFNNSYINCYEYLYIDSLVHFLSLCKMSGYTDKMPGNERKNKILNLGTVKYKYKI